MGPSTESLALADFLISKLGLQVDRISLAYAIMDHVEVEYSEELSYEDRIAELEAALAARQPVGEPVAVRVTPDMRAAFRKAYREGGFWHDRLDTALDAMMRAAPPAQAVPPAQANHPYQRIPGLQGVGDAADYLTRHPGDEYAERRLRERVAEFCQKHGVSPPAQAVDLPYSLDADPAGIRARVCDVITGTLMVGAQGHTPPPAGHWAEPFWKAARADAAAQAVDLERFRPAVMTALGLSSPYGLERETLNGLLDLIDSHGARNG
ncbi:MAG: hypothetical protein PBU97_07940 [Stenotrophomonas maltophilia]